MPAPVRPASVTAETTSLDVALLGVAVAALGFAWVSLTGPSVLECGTPTGSLWVGVAAPGLTYAPGCLLRWKGVVLYGGLALAGAGLLGDAVARRRRREAR